METIIIPENTQLETVTEEYPVVSPLTASEEEEMPTQEAHLIPNSAEPAYAHVGPNHNRMFDSYGGGDF